ncbi:hypothetical protein NCC78_04585 [Micromonospora phytophila]|uniref:hypothetical protein n=1 Tax=Micromonospora phytophila TaxID=709888 RepID=UPI00202FF82D|nr:hypothetical protein [Micromonospora phytophila]MCM0673983.1 hypothetical protein [Micromonospora phytophila]
MRDKVEVDAEPACTGRSTAEPVAAVKAGSAGSAVSADGPPGPLPERRAEEGGARRRLPRSSRSRAI